MMRELANLFGQELDKDISEATVSKLLISGAAKPWLLGIAPVAGVIPWVGNLTKGVITAVLVRSIGKAILSVLQDGQDLSSVSSEDWRRLLAERGWRRHGNTA